MNLKKVLSVATLAVVLGGGLFVLTGCGNEETSTNTNTETNTANQNNTSCNNIYDYNSYANRIQFF